MSKRKVTEHMIMKINLKMRIDACIQLFQNQKIAIKIQENVIHIVQCHYKGCLVLLRTVRLGGFYYHSTIKLLNLKEDINFVLKLSIFIERND